MGTHLATILLLIVTIAQPMAQDISSKFPYESKYIDVLGSKMHYVDEYGKGKHYIQEDHPHEIGQAIKDWII